MLDIIVNNPFRILGVFANSSQKDIVANKARMKAFLNVGRTIAFDSDFDKLLPQLKRTEAAVLDADSKISLAKERIKYAQFWFIKSTSIDDVAFNHLWSNDIEQAISIWSKNDSLSSLHNRIICCLILEKYADAFLLAKKLFRIYHQVYQMTIAGNDNEIGEEELVMNLIEPVKDKLFIEDLLDSIENTSVRERIAKDAIESFNQKIKGLVSDANNGPQTIDEAQQLAFACSPYLGEIYSICKYIEGGDFISQRISTVVGERMLSMIIDDVNKAIKEFEKGSSYFGSLSRYDLIKKFEKSLNTVSLIKDLRLENSFVNGRLRENEEALKKLYKDVNTYSYLTPASVHMDLRGARSYYASCKTPQDYLEYCKRYPYAHNIKEAEERYDELSYKVCKTAADYKQYIAKFPDGKYIIEAKKDLENILFSYCDTIYGCEEYLRSFSSGYRTEEVRERLSQMLANKKRQQEKADSFDCLDALVSYFNENREACDLEDIWADRAFGLARSIQDFLLVAETFKNTGSGKKAKEEYENRSQERKEMLGKLKKWVGIPVCIIALSLLIGWLCGKFLATATILLYILSISVGVGAFLISMYKISNSDRPGCLVFLFTGLGVACATPLWMAGEALTKYEKRLEVKSELFENPTKEKCEEYIRNYPSDSDRDRILSLWLSMLLKESTNKPSADAYSTKPLARLKAFADDYPLTPQGQLASERLNAICDSLYNIAVATNTIDGWKDYKFRVPESKYRDADDRIETIRSLMWSTDSAAWATASNLDEQTAYETYLRKYPRGQHRVQAQQKVAEFKYGIEWSTESKAWTTASHQNDIAGYEKYLEIYPSGAHANAANRKIVELNVQYAEANGRALPKMDRIGFGYGTTSKISVTNKTSYRMTIKYYGPVERTLTISPNSTESITLPNGKYSIKASVSNVSVRDYYGSDKFNGGYYAVEYVIETTFGNTRFRF